MSSLQEHLILRESSFSYCFNIDHRSVNLPSIRNLLNPEILPLKSPEIIQGGYIPTGDIPELEVGGLGPPAVKFTESKKVLNHFPSHSEDLKLLDLSKPAFSPTPRSVLLFSLQSSSIPKSSPASAPQSQQPSAADFTPIPISVPGPVVAMYFLSKFNSTGFGGIVTDGPSPYWKYSPSSPYYPPPGPLKSDLSSVLAVAPTAPYSPLIPEWQAYNQSYFSAKMQRKRQRSVSPDAYPSRKYQRTGEGNRHELTSICSCCTAPLCRLLNRCDPNKYLCAGEGDRQELPAASFQCEGPLRELATQYAPDDGSRAEKEALYDPSSVDHQGETSCWADSGLLEYQMLRQRSRDSGCDTDGPSNSPMTASPHSIKRSSIVLRSYKESLPPFEGLNPITSNVLTSDSTPPQTLTGYVF